MKHRVKLLAVLPLALAFANTADAGFRCGGCSDPCRPRHGLFRHHGGHFGRGAYVVSNSYYGPSYGSSIFQSNAIGAVGADGSYLGNGYGYGYNTGSYYGGSQPFLGHGLSYGSAAYASNAFAGCYNYGGAGYSAPLYSGAVNYGSAYGSAVNIAPSASYAPSVYSQAVVSQPAQASYANAGQVVAGCEPITGYRTVMESTFVTETQYVNTTETRQETRQRVRQIVKSVPVTYQDYRIRNVTVPRTETKTVEYSVLVPEQSTKTVMVNVSVPVWNEISENYMVKVPKISDVEETYTVKVPQLRDQTITYTVYVPTTETVTRTQTVTNAVPVVKTRMVQRTVPKYSTQMVTKDYGHWETVVEEVAGSSYGIAPGAVPTSGYAPAVPTGGCGPTASAVVGGGCGSTVFSSNSCATVSRSSCLRRRGHSRCGCGHCSGTVSSYSVSNMNGCGGSIVAGPVVSGAVVGCGSGSSYAMNAGSVATAPVTTTRRVWVPSIVQEPVQVVTNEVVNQEVAFTVYEQQTTQVPYEASYVVYRPEQRNAVRKVVDYVNEERKRTRKVVSYVDEQRTRTRRELSYKTEAKEETYPVVSYRTEKKTKDISFTVNEPQQSVEPFQATRMETTTEDVIEDYVVNVQVPVVKEVQVQVFKLVPKLVPYTFNPCAGGNASAYGSATVSSASYQVLDGSAAMGYAAPAAYGFNNAAYGSGCGTSVQYAPAVQYGRPSYGYGHSYGSSFGYGHSGYGYRVPIAPMVHASSGCGCGN